MVNSVVETADDSSSTIATAVEFLEGTLLQAMAVQSRDFFRKSREIRAEYSASFFECYTFEPNTRFVFSFLPTSVIRLKYVKIKIRQNL